MARRKQKDIADVKIGHNSNLNDDEKRKLNGFVTEIERLEAQKRVISQDISEIYKSAGESGFDNKAMRHLVKLRAMQSDARREFEHAVEAYQLAFEFGGA